MSRFSRINVIWRKELIDTLRDRRTLVAMVLVPMVLYPVLMLGSIQAVEVQMSYLATERYDVAVADEDTQRWLQRLIDSDPARQDHPQSAPAEQRIAEPASQNAPSAPRLGRSALERSGVQEKPPELRVRVFPDAIGSLLERKAQAAVILKGPPPAADSRGSTRVIVAYDETDVRSRLVNEALDKIFERAGQTLLTRRLSDYKLDPNFVKPLDYRHENIAPPERMTGAVMGTVIPLILILMTLTGSIYPAIDLTAGERERGTLETLMVAPVPTVELIAGKFIVVTLIGLLSALLNLLSVAGTIFLGGVGQVIMPGSDLSVPLSALPLILLMLIPLAVMFSAMLLAVCSFARSFKEAQNYIMPVLMAAMIPGVVGVLPGTRLEGPIVIMPVANIVVLTRELFLGTPGLGFEILLVVLSTCMYAGAAVAIAAKLFGQEAVLFADAGSIKTLFQRRYFRPRETPSIAAVLLTLAIVYSLNFYIQNALARAGLASGMEFLYGLALTFVVLFVVGPWIATRYLRADAIPTFALRQPAPSAYLAALCFGMSTWILVAQWFEIQNSFLRLDPALMKMMDEQLAWVNNIPLPVILIFMAALPAICEELFFRGFLTSGLRSGLGGPVAVAISALAFGMAHYMAIKLIPTAALGVLLGLLAVQFRSIWPE